MAGARRRSTRQAATQHRSVYVEPDSEDDFEANSSEDVHQGASGVRAPRTSVVASHRRKRTATAGPSNYVEPNTDDEFEAMDTGTIRRSLIPAAPPPKRRKAAPRTRTATRSRVAGKRPTTVIGGPRRANSQANPEKRLKRFSGPSDNRIPDWTSLPVNIWKDIFIFGSHVENACNPTQEEIENRSWLLSATRTCRALVQPALEAYYQSPRMLNPLQPHQLLALLRKPKDSRLLDYNVKVKSLLIDVEVLAHVAHLHSHFDLSTLVEAVPQLQHCQVFSRKHLPPYRLMGRSSRWTMPTTSMIRVMTENNTKLRSWRWSRNMIDKEQFPNLYATMAAAHSSKPFERLEELIVCGFNFEGSLASLNPGVEEKNDIAEHPAHLSAVIPLLQNLKDLTFNSCDMIMDNFLQDMPPNLQRIELTNCLEITSDMVRDYFRASGGQLREVVLNHNPALSLKFLTNLRHLCPRLEALTMDLTYYSERLITNDADPLYDELLSCDEFPTWPCGLQHLELLHAQKWSADAAGNLFRSLVDSAPALLDLRKLIIHAHINIPWRDRVGFRDQWIERLNRVFARPWTEPDPHLGSLRQYRLWKQTQVSSSRVHSTIDELAFLSGADRTYARHLPAEMQPPPQVVVKRVQTTKGVKVDSETEVLDRSPSPHPRRSTRVADSQLSQISKTEASSSETSSEDETDNDWRKQPEKYIQGLCDLVDVRIDNQRPRETTFTERDFLDSEQSGDEDWDENAEEHDDERYAW